ncbi:energy-coupling factor transporter transmembrane component T family protein [Labrys wisconsinensis]|uniref:Energy-coupling factor transport system permease protein n=1 Tax=Labrys wisconsinensis TaxID=425677 RepID=A0ABU0J7S5_9HYPH|nr:energy-coupling factor transporter transmembrane component T [Labrys wisconsinensis]MDQ0470318.1 energy-coupling factor transport system permease protein [Labrys wisconsinensis]
MAGWRRPEDGQSTLLFSPGTSLLHRANPLTSLALMLWMLSAAIILPTPAAAVLLAAAIAAGLLAGVGRRALERLAITMGPVGLALLLVHGFLVARPDLVPFGPVSVSPSGLAYALRVFVRLTTMLAATLLFVTTTHPGDLLKALDQRGVPPGVGYLVASPLLLIEPFSERARAIRDAQRARGLDTGGSWRARAAALPILLIPLITLALADLDHRASILSARAFRAQRRRTVIDAPADDRRQVWLRRALLLAAVLQLGLPLLWR